MDFTQSGFQSFPSLFTFGALSAARQAAESLIIQARQGALDSAVPLSQLKPHRNPGIDPQAVGSEPFIINSLPIVSATFRQILLLPSLWAAAATILQSDQVIYHFANLTRKPPHIGPNLTWHRDYPNRGICPADSRHFFRLLIPLEDMDPENGCTLALPDTQQVSDDQALQQEGKLDLSTTALANAIPLATKAGHAIALHPKLIHGGTENRSPRHRNLLVLQFGLKTENYLHYQDDGFTGLTRQEIEAA